MMWLFQVHKSCLHSHTVYASNMERIINRFWHPSELDLVVQSIHRQEQNMKHGLQTQQAVFRTWRSCATWHATLLISRNSSFPMFRWFKFLLCVIVRIECPGKVMLCHIPGFNKQSRAEAVPMMIHLPQKIYLHNKINTGCWCRQV